MADGAITAIIETREGKFGVWMRHIKHHSLHQSIFIALNTRIYVYILRRPTGTFGFCNSLRLFFRFVDRRRKLRQRNFPVVVRVVHGKPRLLFPLGKRARFAKARYKRRHQETDFHGLRHRAARTRWSAASAAVFLGVLGLGGRSRVELEEHRGFAHALVSSRVDGSGEAFLGVDLGEEKMTKK